LKEVPVSSLKRITVILAVVFAFPLVPAFAATAEDVTGKTFYTAANIWYEKPGPIESTNFHRGVIIPIGTKVKIREMYDGSSARNALDNTVQEHYVRFDDEAGQSYQFVFKRKNAKRGSTIWDLFQQYFSKDDPMAPGGPFKSLSAEEQQAVIAGEVREGMSRSAVLMAYGYPPGSKTPILDADEWVYWDSRRKLRTVAFEDGQVADPDQEGGSTKGRRSKNQPKASARPAASSKPAASPMEECIRICKENTKRSSEQCFDACNK
jgi:hypothetical protein